MLTSRTDTFHLHPCSLVLPSFWTHHIYIRSTTGMHSECGPMPIPSLYILIDPKGSLNIYRTQSTRIYYICLSSLFIYIQAVPDFQILGFWAANTFMHYTSTLHSAFCMPNPDFHTSADQRAFCANVWWHCLTAKSSVWAVMPSLSGRADFI